MDSGGWPSALGLVSRRINTSNFFHLPSLSLLPLNLPTLPPTLIICCHPYFLWMKRTWFVELWLTVGANGGQEIVTIQNPGTEPLRECGAFKVCEVGPVRLAPGSGLPIHCLREP